MKEQKNSEIDGTRKIQVLVLVAMKGGSYGSNKGSSGPNPGLLNQKSS
jgi:hypothetical protein